MIRMENITAGYRGVTVLRDVNLKLPRGSLTVLIGPNGSGKSTLLKTAAGLIRPEKGEIWLEGQALGAYAPKILARKMALLPQQREVPAMTVWELAAHGRYPHLSFPRTFSPADHQAVEDALESLQLQTLAERQLSTLSGGERQRSYLAMLLAQQAELLLLDEPATHMDIACQLELLALIRELHGKGKTLLVVMHDLAAALTLDARLCLMEQGRITALGSADELLASGAVERAFGVKARRTWDESGKAYVHFDRP